MNFYTIYPSEHVDRDFSFYLKGNQDKVVDYFKFNDSSTGFLKNPRINMTYDNDFEGNLDEILNTDFYYSASGILLFGITMLYGATGTFDIGTLYEASISASTEFWFYIGVILITIGMLFKVAATPMHFWAPDVYEGAPTQVTAIMSTLAKVAAMASFFKLITILNSQMLYSYTQVIVVVVIATMLFGNVMALRQKKIKR